MKKKILEALKILLFLSIGVLIIAWFWYTMKPEDKEQFWSSLERANYFWIAVAITLGTLAHVSRAWRWRLIIQPFGYNPKKSNLFFAVMNMYFFNMAVPRLGEVTRCATLQRYEKIPFEKTFGTVVAERAMDLIVLLILMAATAALQMENVPEIIDNIRRANEEVNAGQPKAEPSFFMKNLKFILLGFVVLVAGFLYLMRNHPFFGKFFRKFKTLAKGFWEGLKSITKVKSLPEFFGHTVFIWLMYFTMTYVCFFSLPETSHVSLMAPLVVLVFGSVAITVIPNGIGVFPVIVWAILSLKDFGALDKGTGLALGWIIWGSQTILILLVGTISMILLPIFNKGK